MPFFIMMGKIDQVLICASFKVICVVETVIQTLLTQPILLHNHNTFYPVSQKTQLLPCKSILRICFARKEY